MAMLAVADPGEGGPPPLFLDQNEVWRAAKKIFEAVPHPPIPPPPRPPLSEGTDPPLVSASLLEITRYMWFPKEFQVWTM